MGYQGRSPWLVSHWGGGVFIHAEDQARIGLMMLARGQWAGRRILSARWIDCATRPRSIYPASGKVRFCKRVRVLKH
jgi:CubicO group peptidase (beta-lactamase class C family)